MKDDNEKVLAHIHDPNFLLTTLKYNEIVGMTLTRSLNSQSMKIFENAMGNGADLTRATADEEGV